VNVKAKRHKFSICDLTFRLHVEYVMQRLAKVL